MIRLLLLRHADRDLSLGALADTGLSPWGRDQAQKLQQTLLEGDLVTDVAAVRVWSSPKLRCQQTIEPLAQALGARFTKRGSVAGPHVEGSEGGAARRAEAGVRVPEVETCGFLDEGGDLAKKWGLFLEHLRAQAANQSQQVQTQLSAPDLGGGAPGGGAGPNPNGRGLLIIACTHGDVAPYFIEKAIHRTIHLEKAGGIWLGVEFSEGTQGATSPEFTFLAMERSAT